MSENTIKEITEAELGTYVCECGNTIDGDGFSPCDKDGNEMVPTLGSDWDGLSVCIDCGKIHRIQP